MAQGVKKNIHSHSMCPHASYTLYGLPIFSYAPLGLHCYSLESSKYTFSCNYSTLLFTFFHLVKNYQDSNTYSLV